MSTNEDDMATDKILEKIGDHFNNPEMADRILVVKVRPQGWEMKEAANLANTAIKTALNKEKGHSEKTPKPGQTEGKSSSGSRNSKKLTSSSENVFHETDLSAHPDGYSWNAASCITDSQPEEQTVRCGTKRKKNHSEDISFLSEDTNINLDSSLEDCKSPFDVSVDVTATQIVEVKTEVIDPTEECTNDVITTCKNEEENISQPDKRVCIEETNTGDEKSVVQQDHSCVVCEHEIFVHSFWLALNSPFFRGLFFSSGMKETKDKKVVMNICQSMSDMFLVLIESLYKPEVIFDKSVDELLILMRLAHAYDTETTLKTCQRILDSAELSIPICDKALNMQDHERLPEMDDFDRRCQQFLVESFSPLDYQWTREDFFSLSANALHSVLSSNDLCVSNENTVFLALMRWAEVNETYGQDLKPLLELVRFKTMTINYLHDTVTCFHPIASTVPKFPDIFEEAVFFHAFSKERQVEEGDQVCRKAFDEPILFNWHVENYEDTEFEKKKKIVKSPHFWVSGYEMFLELKLRSTGFQGLYLTICTRQFLHQSKGFVKLKYSLSSNFLKATHVFNEVDIFDKEGSGWGYEEFFPLVWSDFKEQLKRTPLIITAQVRLLE